MVTAPVWVGFGSDHCVSHFLEICPGWVRKKDDFAGFECGGRPQAEESRQPLHTGKGKTTASALEPSEGKAALLTHLGIGPVRPTLDLGPEE